MVVTETIDAACSLEEAFTYVSDFTTVADWDPGVRSSRRVSGDGGLGTVYEVQASFRGKTLPFSYSVITFEPNRRIVLDGVGEKATSLDTIVFESTGNGKTKITYTAEFGLKGVLRLAGPFLGGTFRSLARDALLGLATKLDGAR
jgi:carbon monoxide dehydrogenase subunit G